MSIKCPEDFKEFEKVFQGLMAEAEELQSIAALANIHTLLFFASNKSFKSLLKDYNNQYRQLSDRLTDELQRKIFNNEK